MLQRPTLNELFGQQRTAAPELKIILDFKIHPIVVSDSHGTAQVTGLIKDDPARQLD